MPNIGNLAHYPTWSVMTASKKLRRRVSQTKTLQVFRGRFHISPPPIERPVFIIGTVRSGKTTLARCLGRHPQVIYPGRELSAEWRELAEIKIARSSNSDGYCPPYSELDATHIRRHNVREGFAELVASQGGGRRARFIDDNPHLWNKLPFVRRIFPDGRFLVVSRDIRSTVASAKVLWMNGYAAKGTWYYFPRDQTHCWGVIPPVPADGLEVRRIFPGGDIAVLAEYWLHTHSMIEEAMVGFETPVLVKHREFVANPDPNLAEIFRAVDLPKLSYPLPSFDVSRSESWLEILTPREKRELDAFIDSNSTRIERLKYADTYV